MHADEHSRQHILQMLELQQEINQHITTNWREQHYPWYRAMWVECAEMLDHHGWKWWKKQTPDWNQLHMELIDIWHFGLSDCLQFSDDLNLTSDALFRLVHLPSQEKVPQTPESLLAAIETLAQDCLQFKRFPMTTFAELLSASGLSFEDLVMLYIGKNTLNTFRQNNGYQDGSYQKVWNGQEDNEILSEILEHCSVADIDLKNKIYQSLADRYPATTQQRAMG